MVATEITYIGEWGFTKYRRNAQFLSKIKDFFHTQNRTFLDFSAKYMIFLYSLCFLRVKANKGPPGHYLVFSCLGQVNR